MANFCAYSLKWFFHCLNTNNLIPWTLFPEISSHLSHTQTRSVINMLIFLKVISYDILNYILWISHLFEPVLLTSHLELHIILTLKQEHLFVEHFLGPEQLHLTNVHLILTLIEQLIWEKLIGHYWNLIRSIKLVRIHQIGFSYICFVKFHFLL